MISHHVVERVRRYRSYGTTVNDYVQDDKTGIGRDGEAAVVVTIDRLNTQRSYGTTCTGSGGDGIGDDAEGSAPIILKDLTSAELTAAFP